MNRRNFIGAAALGAAAGVARPIEAVAFDGLAIFDPRPIGVLAEEMFPAQGANLLTAWRTRQFEYTWLRTLTRDYADFWRVTADALVFASDSLKVELTAVKRERLMNAWLELRVWPDVLPTLRALKAAGIRRALLTNFTAAMQDANIRNSSLDEFFDARLTTDEVAAFKPDPRSYQMGVAHFSLPRSAIAFVAFGGWDAVGASRFGYPTYWCNRMSQPAEQLGIAADRVAATLADLPSFVGIR